MAQPTDGWRSLTLQLAAARGPQSLSALERIFCQSYMPLGNAIENGLDDPRATHAHDEFRRTFEKSYTDACPMFAVTGKRPKMVLDAPDIAGRIARLHGARATQLLLVDSMRWDVGVMVRQRLVALLEGRASLTDELLLWSALPTTTARQLETLARGIDALRAPPSPDEGDQTESLRGRSAEIVRRLRIGRRDLFKLDLLESQRRVGRDTETTESSESRIALSELADSVARVIARHAETLAPRTLLFVFGDHGFVQHARPRHAVRVQTTSEGSAAGSAAGATPEEVLVPAFAFLFGDVH